MRHPLLKLAEREQLNTDDLSRGLNPARVASARGKVKPYKLSDAGGLFLLVLPQGEDASRAACGGTSSDWTGRRGFTRLARFLRSGWRTHA